MNRLAAIVARNEQGSVQTAFHKSRQRETKDIIAATECSNRLKNKQLCLLST